MIYHSWVWKFSAVWHCFVESESSDEAFWAAGSSVPPCPPPPRQHRPRLQGDQAQVWPAEDGREWVQLTSPPNLFIWHFHRQGQRRRSAQAPLASPGGWEPTSPLSRERGWDIFVKKLFFCQTKLWMRLERDIPNIENHYTTATVWFLKSGNIQARRATVNRVRECWLTVLLGNSAVFVFGVVHYYPKIRDDAIFLTHTVYCFWVWLPLVRFPICHEASGLWNLTRGWSLPPTPLWENPVFFWLLVLVCSGKWVRTIVARLYWFKQVHNLCL